LKCGAIEMLPNYTYKDCLLDCIGFNPFFKTDAFLQTEGRFQVLLCYFHHVFLTGAQLFNIGFQNQGIHFAYSIALN